jgi:hypothetical protein
LNTESADAPSGVKVNDRTRETEAILIFLNAMLPPFYVTYQSKKAQGTSLEAWQLAGMVFNHMPL